MQLPHSPNGSPILLLTSNASEANFIKQPAELSVSGPAISSSTGRSLVVGTPPHLLEWEKPDYSNTINDNSIRCLLGCNLQPEVRGPQPNSLFTLIAWLPHLQSRYKQRSSQRFQSFCAWTIPQLLPTYINRKGGTVSPMLL